MAGTDEPEVTPEDIREEVQADLAELEDEARAEERARIEEEEAAS